MMMRSRTTTWDSLPIIYLVPPETQRLRETRVFVNSTPLDPRVAVPACKMEDHTEVELYECVNKSFGGL